MTTRNRDVLVDALSARYDYDIAVMKFLREHIGANMEHFAESITQEILTSSPLPGVTMLDQLNCYNQQFIQQESKLISDSVLERVDTAPQYTITDGISTTRYGAKHYQGKPDDILKSWWSNSGRTAQARDDTPGDLTWNAYNNESAVGDTVGHHTGQIYGGGMNRRGQLCAPTPTIESMTSNDRTRPCAGYEPGRSYPRGNTPTAPTGYAEWGNYPGGLHAQPGRNCAPQDAQLGVSNGGIYSQYGASPAINYNANYQQHYRENVTNGPIWANPYTTAARPYNSGVDPLAVIGEYGANGDAPRFSRTGNNGSHGQRATNDPSGTNLQYPLGRAPLRCNTQPATVGITFMDQSELGTSNHVSQYENTSYKVWLNNDKTCLPHENKVFGDSTPEADERLLSRRIFRSNFATDKPVENAIPNYELRLQRRAIDRDIDETLHNAEKGCLVLGHDMSTLYNRIDRKQQTQARYDPARFPSCFRQPTQSTSVVRGNTQLSRVQPRQYTNIAGDLPVVGNRPHVTDDARYC